MSAGIDHARGDYVALVHADLQDPPELLPDMLRIARDGADVVYARRIGRDEPWHKRLLATAFYKLMERLARVPYQGQAGDFRLMSRRVVDIVRDDAREPPLPARHGGVGRVRAGAGRVPAGRTAERPRRLVPLAVPARRGGDGGVLRRAAGGRVDRRHGRPRRSRASPGSCLVLATIFGWVTASLGVWTLITLLFLGGVQLIRVGILGRYLARVHEQTLRRPLYLVDRVVEPAREPSAIERWLFELWHGAYRRRRRDRSPTDFVGHWPDREVQGRDALVELIRETRDRCSARSTFTLEIGPFGERDHRRPLVGRGDRAGHAPARPRPPARAGRADRRVLGRVLDQR